MAATVSPATLQQELEELRRELEALMAEWADTDCFAAQRLGVLECRRQLLLARIRVRERALADCPQPVDNPVDSQVARAS